LSNALASGQLGELAGQLISSAAHQFLGINPDTGRIIGAIAGNLIFGLGGGHNALGNIGKLVLDQLVSGRFHRPVHPFVSPRPDLPSFQLDFHAERDKCLREKRLFEDPEFPANDQSLYYSKASTKLIEWKRPGVSMGKKH
jgi:calpain